MDGNSTAYFFVFTFVDDCLRIVEKSRSLCKEINNDICIKQDFHIFPIRYCRLQLCNRYQQVNSPNSLIIFGMHRILLF